MRGSRCARSPRASAATWACPPRAIPADRLQAHFGFLAMLIGLDNPTSTRQTRRILGWEPVHPGLLADFGSGDYFPAPRHRRVLSARTSNARLSRRPGRPTRHPVTSNSMLAASDPGGGPDSGLRGGRAMVSSDEPIMTVYWAPWCPHCKRVKKFLAAHQVRYTLVDIDTDPGPSSGSRSCRTAGRSSRRWSTRTGPTR